MNAISKLENFKKNIRVKLTKKKPMVMTFDSCFLKDRGVEAIRRRYSYICCEFFVSYYFWAKENGKCVPYIEKWFS